MNKVVVANLLPSPFFFSSVWSEEGDNNKLAIVAFFFISVVTKKPTATSLLPLPFFLN
jgi:hypothetical protein